jgi:hypothetical protein
MYINLKIEQFKKYLEIGWELNTIQIYLVSKLIKYRY